MKYPYGKTVFITGASSGIGLACAKMFASAGYTVFAGSRRTEYKKEWVSRGMIYSLKLDVTDIKSCEDAYLYIMEKTDKIGVIIHCAGYGIAGSAEDTFYEDTHSIMETNYFGVLNINRIFIPDMRKNKNGLIIAISSVAGKISIPYQSHYSSSKFALEAYIEAMRCEIKQFGLRACLIEPGDTKTDFTGSRKIAMPEDSAYKKECIESIEKMAIDEQKGKPPESAAKVALKLAERKNPPIRVAVGIIYKMIIFARKFLPDRLVEFAVKILYT